MTEARFCPHCGAARPEWAKFCGTCGKAYDVAPAPGPVTAAALPAAPVVEPPSAARVVEPPPVAPARGRGRSILTTLGLLAVLGGLLYFVGAIHISAPGLVTSSADIPPVGQIWFGSSFDTSSFELRGRTSAIGAHDGFSGVAHTTRSIDGSSLAMRISWNGSVVSTVALTWQGSGDLWGFSPGPLIEPGAWRYELIDVGGNVLASGTITAT